MAKIKVLAGDFLATKGKIEGKNSRLFTAAPRSQKKPEKKKRGCLARASILVFGVFVLLVGVAIFAPVDQKSEPSNTHISASKPNKTADKTINKIGAGVLAPYTKKGYPKLFGQYKSRLKEIEDHRSLAAKKVAANSSCDIVVASELSTKSMINKLKYYVDCKNGKRFNFNEDDFVKTTKPKEKNKPSSWGRYQGSSKMDDSPIYQIYTDSIENEPFGTNYLGKPAQLIIECRENKTSLYVVYHSFINADSMRVTARIDKETAKTTSWSPLTSYDGIWRNAPIRFIKTMLGGDKLVLRLTPYGESPQTRTFNITNIKKEIEPIRLYCGW